MMAGIATFTMRVLHVGGIVAVFACNAAQANTIESTSSNGLVLGSGSSSPTSSVLKVTQHGKVGIGTTTPTAEVEVDGSISGTALYSRGVLVSAPVGIILPWHKSMSGVPTLPAGWVECNGQVISDAQSPINGQTVPNLNGQVYAGGRGYYLRGGDTSGSFNNSSYYTGNGSLYRFGQTSGSYYGIGYSQIFDTETGTVTSYSGSDNTLGARRIQVAAMTVVFIMKIK